MFTKFDKYDRIKENRLRKYNMFFKKLRSIIYEYFRRRFYPYIFNLRDDYADVFSFKDELEKRNVLIGTIRRRTQYERNINSLFYHIPTSQIQSESGIEYVALYKSKSIFNNENDVNGITHYARVIETSHVKRSEITEIPSTSGEEYIRFNVEKWCSLAQAITIKEKYPKVFSKTSMYLLSRAKCTYELYFETVEEYVFYLGICDIINDLYDGFELFDMLVIRRGGKIKIKSKGFKKKFKIKQFKQAPYDTVCKVFAFL